MRRPLNGRIASNDLSFRQIVAAVLLFIFTISNYAVQTHVHGSAFSNTARFSVQTASAPSSGGSADDDKDRCPLCQEYLSGGSFVAPAVAVVLPPILVIAAQLVAFFHIAAPSRSHSWLSRGPPTVSR